ncbi:hypothetical protein [Xylanimonas protaetiae]|uniref:NfeD-like C-terminal domain-containing protein n=1 Tax=Xylanimonas protaetiae TaxID=2509457 RepID=A0A4P6F725_9MICO|nr:hypothetical protein [Xylanimonas protaetiae]QAY71236.1 hypothetical protein ET471_15360 [Xylanimonas protaetiae]
MTTGFLVVGIAATVVALLALLFDGVFEAFDLDLPGDGSVSVLALTGGLAAFGWSGLALASLTDLPSWAIVLIAVAAGVLVAAGGGVLTSVLRRQSTPDGAGSVATLTGVTGVMDTPAAPGKPGVVRVVYSGSPRTLTAHATVAVAAGTLVTVAAVVSPDVVRVTPAEA